MSRVNGKSPVNGSRIRPVVKRNRVFISDKEIGVIMDDGRGVWSWFTTATVEDFSGQAYFKRDAAEALAAAYAGHTKK